MIATYKQTRAIFFKTKTDVRGSKLSVEQASDILDWLNNKTERPGCLIGTPLEDYVPEIAPDWELLLEAAHARAMTKAFDQYARDLAAGHTGGTHAWGTACVRIVDARKGLARWLLKTKRGDRDYRSGAKFKVVQFDSSAANNAYARSLASTIEQALKGSKWETDCYASSY